jgi:hypothetical protein
VVAEFFGGVFDFEEDAASAFEENFPGFRENGLAPEAVEELTANLGLEIYYLLT